VRSAEHREELVDPGADENESLRTDAGLPRVADLPTTAIFTASSKSQSSKTINGSLPLNSMVDFFKFFPARAARDSPARSDPVSATPLVRGSSINLAT